MPKVKLLLSAIVVFFIAACSNAPEQDSLNLNASLEPVPPTAKFFDPDFYIWGAGMVRDSDGVCHLFYSRWPRELGHNAWVTHSEIAHAVADQPLGPYKHVDVALPPRGAEFWDGLCTHNPTVHEFDGKYYIYYMGNTGDGQAMKKLNWVHRNKQRIGVAVADHPNGPWKRFDSPLIDIAENDKASDALMTSNPSVCRKSDGTFVMVYKAVGKEYPMPFGGPVVHMVAFSQSPLGPFEKQPQPIFDIPGERFPAEDPFIWAQDDRLYAILKDNDGYFTDAGKSMVLFQSADGLDWQLAEHPLVSTIQVEWQDKGIQKLHSLERPQLWLENGVPAILFCAADVDSKRELSFNVHIPLKH